MNQAAPEGRNTALDGVRGLAIAVVVIHNTAWISGNSDQLVTKLFTSAAAAGWTGVQLFFVLSGFLITGILLDTRSNTDFFRRFYFRRSLRIFPLYFIVVGIAAFVIAPLQWGSPWAQSVQQNQWAFWLYLSNWTEPFGYGIRGLSHLWSLAVEEQFYLAWPLAIWWLGEKGVFRLALALAVSGPAVRYGLYVGDLPRSALYSFTIARWDALAMGALVALAFRDAPLRALVARWLPHLALLAGIATLAIAARLHGFHDFSLPVLVAGQSLAAVLSACLIAHVVITSAGSPASPTITVFQSPLLRTLGKYSYAMYLIHAPLHLFLSPKFSSWVQSSGNVGHLPRLLLYTLFIFFLSYALARVSWRFIESPILQWRGKWKSGERAPAARAELR